MKSLSELSETLDQVLRSKKCYETQIGLEKRRGVMASLNVLVQNWMQSVSLTRGMHWTDTGKIGGRIVTYGSYMLGVSPQGADIDALCVAPQHITRQEYFTSFYAILKHLAKGENNKVTHFSRDQLQLKWCP